MATQPPRPPQPVQQRMEELRKVQTEIQAWLRNELSESGQFNLLPRLIPTFTKLTLPKTDRAALLQANEKFLWSGIKGSMYGAVFGSAFILARPLYMVFRVNRLNLSPERKLERLRTEPVQGFIRRTRLRLPIPKVVTVFQATALGIFAAMAGSEIGYVLGYKRGERIIESSSEQARKRYTNNLDKARMDLVGLYSIKASEGNMDPIPTRLREIGLASRPNEEGGGDRVTPPSEEFYGRKAEPGGAPQADSSTVQGQISSRWEELRKSQSVKPSKWHTIREENARSSLPNSNQAGDKTPSPSSPSATLPLSSSTSTYPPPTSDREARRREFEALMEKERKGGDDTLR